MWAVETEKYGEWTRWNEYDHFPEALNAAQMLIDGPVDKVRIDEYHVGRTLEFSSSEELEEYRKNVVV